MKPKNVYVIAGPNGSGKTTFAKKFLPIYAHCENFINADLIAQGLSPFSPKVAAIRAGRLVLEQIRGLAVKKFDFAFETTLSGKTYLPFLKNLKSKGYKIHLFFLWIPTVEFALARIKDRVAGGGHDVPAADVRRRFHRGIYNLLKIYRPILDSWHLFDNSKGPHRLIAEEEGGRLMIVDADLFREISEKAGQSGG